jgi:hypothetical protein
MSRYPKRSKSTSEEVKDYEDGSSSSSSCPHSTENTDLGHTTVLNNDRESRVRRLTGENRLVFRIKVLVLLVLGIATVTSGYFTYSVTRASELEAFRVRVRLVGRKPKGSFHPCESFRRLNLLSLSLSSLSLSLISKVCR